MRIIFAVLISLIAGTAFDTARAQQYRWCAIYGGGDDGGGTNCYFVTLQQCRAAVSGVGGICMPSYYDNSGRPMTNEEVLRRKKKS